jgi:IPT/TIG domain-containing protein
MWRRSLARVVALVVTSLAVVTAGCGDSPSSPTPASPSTPSTPSAPPLASVGVLRVAPDAGPTNGGMVIRVTGFGFRAGATLMLGDVAVRVTESTPTTITGVTPAHAAGLVSVSVINPDGDQGHLQRGGYLFGVFSVTASPTVVASGDELTVGWVAPEGRDCNGGGDWIAIYKVGDPDDTGASNGHSDLWYDHLCGATSGSRRLLAPDQPGEYEFRYMVGATSAARSGPVTVHASSASSFLSARGPTFMR